MDAARYGNIFNALRTPDISDVLPYIWQNTYIHDITAGETELSTRLLMMYLYFSHFSEARAVWIPHCVLQCRVSRHTHARVSPYILANVHACFAVHLCKLSVVVVVYLAFVARILSRLVLLFRHRSLHGMLPPF